MRLGYQAAILSGLATVQSFVDAVSIDCAHIRVDKVDFNIKPLSGPHSVYQIEQTGAGETRNRTFTFDLCKKLEHSKRTAGCELGSRVCAFDRLYDKEPKKEIDPSDAWSIAGQFTTGSGRNLDPTVTRLKTEANGAEDSDQEGLRIEMRGGIRPTEDKRPQKFIIDLMCDPDHTGLEDENDEGKKIRRDDVSLRARDDDEEEDGGDESPPDDDDESDRALSFVSYKTVPGKGKESSKVFDVLQVRWYTKYGCEGDAAKDPEDTKGGSHWGFFTWFIIIVFLLIASYLIFGSWLNYNRHGARGWDLLPHGDTIRDVPYLLKDWGRRVISTVQGGGSRGGYSAI